MHSGLSGLPQLLRAFRGTPHAGTSKTANMLMLGRKLRLPELSLNNPPLCDDQAHSEYVQIMIESLEEPHTLLWEQKMAIRHYSEEPSLFQVGDLVLVQNTRRKK